MLRIMPLVEQAVTTPAVSAFQNPKAFEHADPSAGNNAILYGPMALYCHSRMNGTIHPDSTTVSSVKEAEIILQGTVDQPYGYHSDP